MTQGTGPADAGPADSRPDDDLTEVVVESEILRRGHYLTFRIDTVERADGTRAKREVVGHPGAVAILAIDPEDRVLMVRQYRSPAGRVLLEVPAGTLDVDPATGAIEDHAVAARRELEEETGHRAGSWRLLTSFWTAPGFATELMHLYLATDLVPAHEDRLGPDEDERLELERLPWPEALAAAERGEIADAKSLVALLWLDRLTLREGTPGDEVPAGWPVGLVPPESPPTVEPAVSVEYVGTPRELVSASMAAGRRSWLGQLAGFLLLAAGVWLVATGSWLAAVPPIVFGVLLVSGGLTAPAALFAWWRRRDLLRQPTRFVASADGVDYRTPLGSSHSAWPTFTRIRETGAFLFLETGLMVFYVPKRAFTTDDLAAFRRLVSEAGFSSDGRRTAMDGRFPIR
jgi:ADP-ribose pyrophosphatase